MNISKKVIMAIRFLTVSAVVIYLGVIICTKYEINITNELHEEINNLNVVKQLVSYCTLANNKILKNVNTSSLPFASSVNGDDPEEVSTILLIYSLTISSIFSVLYCQISEYDKKAYSKPVRFIFSIIATFAEFELTYCSYEFFVFLSKILPDDFSSYPIFTLQFDYIPGDQKSYILSEIKSYASIIVLAFIACTILVFCYTQFLAIIAVWVAVNIILFFDPGCSLSGWPFVFWGAFMRWLLGNSELCAEARMEYLKLSIHYMKWVIGLVGLTILLFIGAYFSV